MFQVSAQNDPILLIADDVAHLVDSEFPQEQCFD